MSAMLGRYLFTGGGIPIAQYLHRTETLLVEPEFSWEAHKEGALIFPNMEAAEKAAPLHRYRDDSGEHLPIVVICAASRAAAERREADRIATALASVPQSAPLKGVPPSAMKSPDPKVRKRGVRLNRVVAVERKAQREAAADAIAHSAEPNRLEQLKEIYRTKVAPHYVSPEDCYQQTCEHLGEHE